MYIDLVFDVFTIRPPTECFIPLDHEGNAQDYGSYTAGFSRDI
jgi:hypothetical protein